MDIEVAIREWSSILDTLSNQEDYEDVCDEIKNHLTCLKRRKRGAAPAEKPKECGLKIKSNKPKYSNCIDNGSAVYFIRNCYTNNIKIGKANDPFSRVNHLNSLYPENLELLAVVYTTSTSEAFFIERSLHKKFKVFKSRYPQKYEGYSEWYDISYNTCLDALTMLPKQKNYKVTKYV